MFPVSNHSYCETSTNTIKSSIPRTAVLVCETRIAMRSVVTHQVDFVSPLNLAGLQLIDVHLPGSMTFNDTQTAFWKKHTRPEVSKKVQKLVMLSTIAYDQEKAGLHFEGRRSFAEAEVNLLKEELAQTSQAVRTQNPLSYIGNTVKAWVSDSQSLGDGYLRSGLSLGQ